MFDVLEGAITNGDCRGCGRCAVTGGTVQLLYWPVTTSGLPVSGTKPATAVFSNTTLTSPTLYVSYKSLYASDGCQGMGSTIYSTIVPIPTSYVLSTEWATTPISWSTQGGIVPLTMTAPFNVTDLNEPVPYSIYSRQRTSNVG